MSSSKKILHGISELSEKLENLLRQHEAQNQDGQDDVNYIQEILSELYKHRHEVISFLCEEKEQREIAYKNLDRKLVELQHILATPDKGGDSCEDTGCTVMTTGPVIRSELVDHLYVEILNNFHVPQNVRITLYDLEQYPKQHIEHRIVTVLSKYAVSEQFEIGPQGLDLLRFEVEIESLDELSEGIFVFIAGTQGSKYRLIQSNVFRHEQLIRI